MKNTITKIDEQTGETIEIDNTEEIEKHCILLVRVSTSKQDFEEQKNNLKSWASSFHFNHFIIIQEKESARKLEPQQRLGLTRMEKYISMHSECKAVFIQDLSRLSRIDNIITEKKNYFINNRINLYIQANNFILLNENFQINPDTEIIFAIYQAMAKNEMEVKRQRFKNGKMKNKLAGKYNGGLIAFGYTTDSTNHYILDDDTLDNIIIPSSLKYSDTTQLKKYELIQYIYNEYAKGETSIYQMVIKNKISNFPSQFCTYSGLLNLLKNDAYTGKDKSGQIYPQIISRKLYDDVQEQMRKNNKGANKRTKRIYILKNKIICPYCGHTYIANGGTNQYRCGSNRPDNKENKCKGAGIAINIIEGIVWEIVKKDLIIKPIDFNNVRKEKEEKISDLHKQNKQLEKLINESKKNIEKLGFLFIKGIYSEKKVDEENQKIHTEKVKYENLLFANIEKINYIQSEIKEEENIKNRISELNKINDKELKSSLIDMIIESIHVYNCANNYYKVLRINMKHETYTSQRLCLININTRRNEFIEIQAPNIKYFDKEKCFYYIQSKETAELNEDEIKIYFKNGYILNEEKYIIKLNFKLFFNKKFLKEIENKSFPYSPNIKLIEYTRESFKRFISKSRWKRTTSEKTRQYMRNYMKEKRANMTEEERLHENEIRRQYNQKNKEKKNAYMKIYRANMTEEQKQKHREAQKRYTLKKKKTTK